jgi:hypothetical protein
MPSFLRKKNNAKSRLLNPVTVGDSTITVKDYSQFPLEPNFMVTIWNRTQYPDPSDDSSMEILKVTGLNFNVFTVERGQEDTLAKIHQEGNAVELLFTVGQLQELENEINKLSFFASGENHWDRDSGSDTIVPFISNSNLDIGSGNFYCGTITQNSITLDNTYLKLDGSNVPTADYSWTTNFTTTGNISSTAGTLLANTLTLGTGLITDSTGTINFGNEHLITSGNITAEKIYLNYYGDASITHDTIDLIIKSEIGTSAYVDFTNFGLYRFDNDIETSGTITSGRLAHDASTYIDKDGSNNMTFTDAVTGTLTLAELGRATMIDVSDTSVAEGNNSVVIGYDKANLKWLKIATTSTDWTLTIYSSDDYASEPMEIVTNRSGDFNVYLDMPYEDDDATGELHYNFTSASGSETHDIQILGEALR